MKIRVIGEAKKYPKEECINVIPFGKIDRIDFRKQINGSGKELVQLGKFAEKLGGITLVGAESDNCGMKKKSVFVFEGAKLASICDMNEYQEKYQSSYGFKSIEFKGKKIGILVDKDIYSPSAVKAFCLNGEHAIINIYAGLLPKKAVIGCEFYSYVYGIDFVCVSQKEVKGFNARGEEVLMTNNEGFFALEGVFREVRKKQRGNV